MPVDIIHICGIAPGQNYIEIRLLYYFELASDILYTLENMLLKLCFYVPLKIDKFLKKSWVCSKISFCVVMDI